MLLHLTDLSNVEKVPLLSAPRDSGSHECNRMTKSSKYRGRPAMASLCINKKYAADDAFNELTIEGNISDFTNRELSNGNEDE